MRLNIFTIANCNRLVISSNVTRRLLPDHITATVTPFLDHHLVVNSIINSVCIQSDPAHFPELSISALSLARYADHPCSPGLILIITRKSDPGGLMLDRIKVASVFSVTWKSARVIQPVTPTLELSSSLSSNTASLSVPRVTRPGYSLRKPK